MKRNYEPLRPEDYSEPRCVLCDPSSSASIQAVPQQRIIQKLDEYMGQKNYSGAERHLMYWLEEARLGNDERGELMLLNELTGFYRKRNQKEKAFCFSEKALSLLPAIGYEGTISAGTTYVNAATARYTFGDALTALDLFKKARTIYENAPGTAPHLLGGLYNNMGLAYASLKQFPDAHSLYDLAMEKMEQVPNGELEQALTCLNKASALESELGLESAEAKIFSLLDQAYELLHGSTAPADGYFAFVCETCVPTFSYYGYFFAAEELQEKAERIYERT